MEKLIRLAYPDDDSAMMEVLGIDHFIDALQEEEMRSKVRQRCPKTLREAVQTSLELESFQLASRQRSRTVRGVKIDSSSKSEADTTAAHFQKQVLGCLREGLQEVLSQYSTVRGEREKQAPRYQQRRKQLICWSCDQPGHVRKNCPKEKEKTEVKSGANTLLTDQGNCQ